MKRLDALLFLSIGFSLGIACGVFFPSWTFDITAIIGIGAIALGFSFFGRPFFISGIFMFAAMGIGVWMGGGDFHHWANLPDVRDEVSGTGVIVRPSISKSFFRESEWRMETCEQAFCPPEKILLREGGTIRRMTGDRLRVTCALQRPKEQVDISGRSVAYAMVLASRGIGYLCEQPTSVSEVGRASSLAVAFERAIFSVRERFVGVMEDILPSGEAALSLGVLIGADDGFSSAEKTLFVRTGVSHVTAVSGYNITLVGMLLFFLAIVFGWYRRGASVVAIIGIAVYVILVGAPASAVRAGIMGALLLFSFAIGRPGSGFRIWFFSLALMLAFDPLLIRYDIGFQLSYLATLALLLYAGVRETFWMPRIWIVRILYEGMVLSLFVEWLVVPVILIQFGTLSGVSILANTFIVPLVPIIMATSFFAALAGFVIPGGAFFLNGLAFSFAHLFLAGAEFLSGLPGSFFSDLSVSPALVVLWYVVTGYAFYIFSNSADHKGRSLGSLLRTDLYDREKSMKL